MIKGKWKGIIFVLLILLLAVGLSTIALNERSEQESEKIHKMSIALVNEDAGTDFNASPVNFGDEFTNQINKDQYHDWFIVSRGVAESGFERNAYDMMIVIPNNFSENALLIDENAPEQVTLEYKINATGHEDVRADAEKAAGEVLTNFNKQLIDVFFVSIIGNLQEAQDNIGEIIAKEKEYTDEYRVNIFNPLDNFTSQFERVQQYADMSKNNYNQLDDVLNNFETNLSDKAKSSAEYDQEIAKTLQQKEESSIVTSTFAEQFDQHISQMNQEDAQGQMAQLKDANAYLYEQLRDKQDSGNQVQERSLKDRINILNKHFDQVKSDADSMTEFVLDDLTEDLKERIETRVSDSFSDNTIEDIKLKDLINDLDKNILENISNSIGMLPKDGENIDGLVLPDNTKTRLKNVALVSEAFEDSGEFLDGDKGRSEYSLLEEPFKKLEKSLKKDGITITDEITIEEYKNTKFEFTFEPPKGFVVENILINEKPVSEGEVELGKENSQDDLEVKISAKLKLKDSTDIDIFQPVQWDWTLKQHNKEKETTPPGGTKTSSNSSEKSYQDNNKNNNTPKKEIVKNLSTATDAEDESTAERLDTVAEEENEGNRGNEDNGEKDENEDNGEKEENEDNGEKEENGDNGEKEENGDKGEDEEGEDKGEDEEGEDNGEDEEDEDNGEEDEDGEDEESIVINKYHWNQSVQSPLFDQEEFTRELSELFEEAVELYEAIDSLDTMYNLYFGLNLSRDNKKLVEEINKKGLTGLAKKDSLYYLVHKKEVKTIIRDKISSDVADSVATEINQPLLKFQTEIEEYQSILDSDLDNAQGDSENLAKSLEEASAQAGNLNTNVGQVLDDVDKWRENSNDLVAEQSDVISKDSDMQTALLNLDSGFKPILSTSESLAEQAQSNFDSTDQVYETLDSIDEQADVIQQSGLTLVSQANELATKFSDKAAEDMDFADNFNEVLANSRIGDRQNEDLYSFLSNPVESQNTGVIKETESFIPYFLVFIMAIVSFFTAYVLSSHRNRSGEATDFETDQTFIQKNTRPMMITGGIGLIEGLLFGITSYILLDIPQTGTFTWIALITVMMLGMVLIATYALRQLHMIGMFILLVVFSLYLLLTRSLGFQFGGNETISTMRKISPLQQLENWLNSFIEGTMSTTTLTMAFIILIVAAIIGLALNMLIVDTTAKEVGVDDERTKEAN